MSTTHSQDERNAHGDMPSRQVRVDTRGATVDVWVREAGAGTPVLLLHGVPGPASIDSLVTQLSVRHRVIVPTHPGWDGTHRPDALASPGDLAELYLDLLRQTRTGPVAVLGASFGGWVAAEIAVRDRNGLVERLILMDAIGPEIPGHPVAVPSRPSGQPAPAGPPADAMRDTMASFRAYTSAGMQDSRLLSRVASVVCPVLAVWGEQDTMVSPAFGRAYADAFPMARFELIPGAGHLPIREEPEATFAVVDAFLSTSGDRARTPLPAADVNRRPGTTPGWFRGTSGRN